MRRSRTLEAPTCLAARINGAAHELLEKEADGTLFRLLGVGVSDLGPIADADPADLVDTTTERLKAAEGAMDQLRARFGRGAVSRGILMDATTDRRKRK